MPIPSSSVAAASQRQGADAAAHAASSQGCSHGLAPRHASLPGISASPAAAALQSLALAGKQQQVAAGALAADTTEFAASSLAGKPALARPGMRQRSALTDMLRAGSQVTPE